MKKQNKKFGYMIKSVKLSEDGKFGLGFNGFKYPLKKGKKIVAKDWNNNCVSYGGIFGIIHETKKHYIQNKDLWLILKYKIGTEVVVNDEVIKVPYAWIVDCGSRAEIQKKFENLTGKEYEYDFAIQDSKNNKTQIAGYKSVQLSGNFCKQTAGDLSLQTSGDGSLQTSGNCSIQKAGFKSIQITGNLSIQIAEPYSLQTAGEGSVSIIRGKIGYCKHNGPVLQVLCFYDTEKNKYVYLTKIIKDNKKHKLEAVKVKGKWVLKDKIEKLKTR